MMRMFVRWFYGPMTSLSILHHGFIGLDERDGFHVGIPINVVLQSTGLPRQLGTRSTLNLCKKLASTGHCIGDAPHRGS